VVTDNVVEEDQSH